MKLQELGLKSKPQTKYFEGGYVSFSTMDGVLRYKITQVTKTNQTVIDSGYVIDSDHFETLLTMKSIKEWLEA